MALSREVVLRVLLAMRCCSYGYGIIYLSYGLCGSIFIYYKADLRVSGCMRTYTYNLTGGGGGSNPKTGNANLLIWPFSPKTAWKWNNLIHHSTSIHVLSTIIQCAVNFVNFIQMTLEESSHSSIIAPSLQRQEHALQTMHWRHVQRQEKYQTVSAV